MIIICVQLLIAVFLSAASVTEDCQKDSGSAYWNAETQENSTLLQSASKNFCQSADSCRVTCPTTYPGTLKNPCCILGVCTCSSRSHFITCNDENKDVVESFAAMVHNDWKSEEEKCLALQQHFYYGEIILKYGRDDYVSLETKIGSGDNSWTLSASGIVDMNDEIIKMYYFYYLHDAESSDASLDPECLVSSGYGYVDRTKFGNYGFSYFKNIGTIKDPQVATCVEESSCSLVNCENFGFFCVARGTYICVPDANSCPNLDEKVVTTTSTSTCNPETGVMFYYGEITTTDMTGSEIPIKSAKSTNGDLIIIRGMGTTNINTSEGSVKKYFFFAVEFNKNQM